MRIIQQVPIHRPEILYDQLCPVRLGRPLVHSVNPIHRLFDKTPMFATGIQESIDPATASIRGYPRHTFYKTVEVGYHGGPIVAERYWADAHPFLVTWYSYQGTTQGYVSIPTLARIYQEDSSQVASTPHGYLATMCSDQGPWRYPPEVVLQHLTDRHLAFGPHLTRQETSDYVKQLTRGLYGNPEDRMTPSLSVFNPNVLPCDTLSLHALDSDAPLRKRSYFRRGYYIDPSPMDDGYQHEIIESGTTIGVSMTLSDIVYHHIYHLRCTDVDAHYNITIARDGQYRISDQTITYIRDRYADLLPNHPEHPLVEHRLVQLVHRLVQHMMMDTMPIHQTFRDVDPLTIEFHLIRTYQDLVTIELCFMDQDDLLDHHLIVVDLVKHHLESHGVCFL